MHSGSSPACDTMYALQQQWLLSRRVVGFKMAGTQQLDIIVLEEGMGPADSNAELSDVMGINPGEMRSFHLVHATKSNGVPLNTLLSEMKAVFDKAEEAPKA